MSRNEGSFAWGLTTGLLVFGALLVGTHFLGGYAIFGGSIVFAISLGVANGTGKPRMAKGLCAGFGIATGIALLALYQVFWYPKGP